MMGVSAIQPHPEYARGFYDGHNAGRMEMIEMLAKRDMLSDKPLVTVKIENINDPKLIWVMLKKIIGYKWRSLQKRLLLK
jgi:hypothetical protein